MDTRARPIWLRHSDNTLSDEHVLSFGIGLQGGGCQKCGDVCQNRYHNLPPRRALRIAVSFRDPARFGTISSMKTIPMQGVNKQEALWVDSVRGDLYRGYAAWDG